MHARAAGLTLAAATAIATGLSSPALAIWPPDGRLVSSQYSPYGHDQARLLRDASGDVFIVWRFRGGTGTACYAQRITPVGDIAPGWPADAMPLNAYSTFTAALDDSGGVFDAYPSSNYNVYLERTRTDAAHVPLSGPGWTIADSTYTEWYPSVTGDGAGGVYAAYVRGISRVHLKRLLPNGALAAGWPATGLVLVAEPASVALASPALLGDGAGGAYAMWLADVARVQRLQSDGTVAPGWPVAGLALGTLPPELYSSPFLQLLPSDATHVFAAWIDHPGGGRTRVFVQRFTSAGTVAPGWPASGNFYVSTTQAFASLSVVPDGQGGVTLAWEQQSLPRVLHILPDGTAPPGYPGTGASPLDGAAQYEAGSLYAATGRDGGVIASWRDRRPSRPGIRLRWIRADGAADPAEPDSGRVASPPGMPATNRGLLDDGDGGAYAAWEDDSGAPFYGTLLRMNYLPRSGTVDVSPALKPRVALQLEPPVPNPATRAIRVRFTLADDSPARVELLDLAGRRLRAVDVDGAGQRTARFDDLDRVAPGVYFVRLQQRAAVRVARVAIVR